MEGVEFGRWLAAERRRLGLSLAALARQTGGVVSDETIRQAESGRPLRAVKRQAVVDALHAFDQARSPDLAERVAALEAAVAELRARLDAVDGGATG